MGKGENSNAIPGIVLLRGEGAIFKLNRNAARVWDGGEPLGAPLSACRVPQGLEIVLLH